MSELFVDVAPKQIDLPCWILIVNYYRSAAFIKEYTLLCITWKRRWLLIEDGGV